MHFPISLPFAAVTVMAVFLTGATAAPEPAVPTPTAGATCIPAEYGCDNGIIYVCDGSHHWVVSAYCGNGRSCQMIGDVPYCV